MKHTRVYLTTHLSDGLIELVHALLELGLGLLGGGVDVGTRVLGVLVGLGLDIGTSRLGVLLRLFGAAWDLVFDFVRDFGRVGCEVAGVSLYMEDAEVDWWREGM